MTKVCKSIWIDHQLHAYCDSFDGASPSDTTTSANIAVTCNDCIAIVALEASIITEVLA